MHCRTARDRRGHTARSSCCGRYTPRMRWDRSSGNPLARFLLNTGADCIRGAVDRINAEHGRAVPAVAVALVSPSIGDLCSRMVNQFERRNGAVPNGPAPQPRTDRLRTNVNAVTPMQVANCLAELLDLVATIWGYCHAGSSSRSATRRASGARRLPVVAQPYSVRRADRVRMSNLH